MYLKYNLQSMLKLKKIINEEWKNIIKNKELEYDIFLDTISKWNIDLNKTCIFIKKNIIYYNWYQIEKSDFSFLPMIWFEKLVIWSITEINEDIFNFIINNILVINDLNKTLISNFNYDKLPFFVNESFLKIIKLFEGKMNPYWSYLDIYNFILFLFIYLYYSPEVDNNFVFVEDIIKENNINTQSLWNIEIMFNNLNENKNLDEYWIFDQVKKIQFINERLIFDNINLNIMFDPNLLLKTIYFIFIYWRIEYSYINKEYIEELRDILKELLVNSIDLWYENAD